MEQKNEGKTTFQMVQDLQWKIGIPEQVDDFEKEAKALLEHMKSTGRVTHLPYLLDLVRRQQAFIEKVQRFVC